MTKTITQQEVLDILSEECNEVAHIISKIRRFGLSNINPKGDGASNAGRFYQEVLDLLVMVEWATEMGALPVIKDADVHAWSEVKRTKVMKYLGEKI